MLAAAADGPVALVFGREDTGSRTSRSTARTPSSRFRRRDHASLNLAQAVLIALYELHLARRRHAHARPPRKDAPPASADQFERFFADADTALAAIDFFRTRNPEHIVRSLRSLTFRAAPDAREIDLMRAMAIEVMRALERASARARDEST